MPDGSGPSDRLYRAYQTYKDLVWKIVRYILRTHGIEDTGVLEDTVSEIFTKFGENDPGRHINDLGKYFSFRAYKRAIDAVRVYYGGAVLRDPRLLKENKDDDDPASDVLRILRTEQVVRLMARLTARERQAVSLRIFADRTLEEVAREMGITTQRVGQLLDSGATRLFRALREEGKESAS